MQVIYKRTSTGKVQVWSQEISPCGTKYRTVSGQIDGKKVISEWTQCNPKNIGKSNETSAAEQCKLEVDANYTKKLAQGKYHTTKDEIDNAKFFAPMLAKKWSDYAHLYDESNGAFAGCYSQPKLDGVRCILKRDGLWTRNGKPLVSAPHITDAFKSWFEKNPDTIFDGELYSDKLSDNFQKIISLARQQTPTVEELAESAQYLKLYLYDFPCIDKKFSTRYERMYLTFARMTKEQMDVVALVPTYPIENRHHLNQLYAEYMRDGYEGQMIRRDSGRYANERDDQLLKRKEFHDDEFPIVDIIEGEGNWSGMAKSITIKLPNGKIQNSGMRGKMEFAKSVLEQKSKYIGGEATIRYQRLSNDGLLIFPVAVVFYKKKRDI